MSQSVTYDPYGYYMPQAFVGMKADSMFDNVDTHPCGEEPIDFGVVVGKVSADTNGIGPGAGIRVVGIAIHDHLVGSRERFHHFDAVNVLTRGRVWAKVKEGEEDNIADGDPVHFDPETGEVGASGTPMSNAVFRSKHIVVPPVWPHATLGSGLAAVVELHYPNVSGGSSPGPAGPMGPQGPQGPTGPAGPPGPAG
jgi:hypothetical protein